MKRFVEGLGRGQSTLFPSSLDDYVSEDNPVRVVDVFVDSVNLEKLGFLGVQPLETGRPGYHPGVMLKLYIYGYLDGIPCAGAQAGTSGLRARGGLGEASRSDQRGFHVFALYRRSEAELDCRYAARSSNRTAGMGE